MKYTKTLSVIVLLCAATIYGCKKNDYKDDNNNNPVADSNAMKFIVSGATDQVLDWTDSATIPLAVTYTGGEQVKTNLTLTGLPQGATASFDVTGGTPSFASILTLRTNNTPGGVYNLKLLATTIKDSVKSYDMKLTVNGEPQPCTKAGNYENQQTDVNTSDVNIINVTAELTGEKNHLLLKNCIYTDFVDGVNWKNYDVEVVLNCDNKTLQIVHTSFKDALAYYCIGEGTFTENNTLDFTYKITPNGSYFIRTYHCVVKLK